MTDESYVSQAVRGECPREPSNNMVERAGSEQPAAHHDRSASRQHGDGKLSPGRAELIQHEIYETGTGNVQPKYDFTKYY